MRFWPGCRQPDHQKAASSDLWVSRAGAWVTGADGRSKKCNLRCKPRSGARSHRTSAKFHRRSEVRVKEAKLSQDAGEAREQGQS